MQPEREPTSAAPRRLRREEPIPAHSPIAVAERDRGIRRLRHVSNWTLAALLVGVGVSSASLARAVPGAHSAPTSGVTAGTTAGVGATNAPVAGTATPSVAAPVATSSGSTVAAATTGAPAPATTATLNRSGAGS